jgi:hypothetical protein
MSNIQKNSQLNETIQKLRDKEASYDALDAENRRNVAKIGELKYKNERLTQDAKRAVLTNIEEDAYHRQVSLFGNYL